jgi:hypothetical protein
VDLDGRDTVRGRRKWKKKEKRKRAKDSKMTSERRIVGLRRVRKNLQRRYRQLLGGTVLWIHNNIVRYHFGGSMKLNACILLLAHMVYL